MEATVINDGPIIFALSGGPYSADMEGGATTGGLAGVQVSYLTTTAGGITVGGQAIVVVKITYTMSGGVTTGGSSLVSKGYFHVASGGIVTGGATSFSPGKSYLASGGVTTGGAARYEFVMNYKMSGGISMSGDITTNFSLNYTGSGNIALSGISRSVWGRAFTGTGGITLGGKQGNGPGLTVTFKYIPSFPHNRIFVYGKADYWSDSFHHAMTGGVTTGGLAGLNFCANSCDLDVSFYRSNEPMPGCQVTLPTGKTDFVCARPISYLPMDSIRRQDPSAAIVPSITVCQQGLTTNTNVNKSSCSQFIR